MANNTRIVDGITYDTHTPIKIGVAAKYIGRGTTKFKEIVKAGDIPRYKDGSSQQSPAYYLFEDLDTFLKAERLKLGGRI